MTTRNERGAREPYSVAGQRPGRVNNPTQHGDVSGRREAEADWPLPRKAVIHRRRPNAGTRESLDLCHLENMTISQQTEEEDSSREIRGLSPSTDLLEPQREEVEMNRLIHAKKLMLLETILNFEQKVRQKLQTVGPAAGDHQTLGEESDNRASWPQTRPPEQHWRQSVKQRGDQMEERQQEGGKHLRTKPRQRDEDRTRNRQEVWRAAGARPEYRREVNDASIGSKRDIQETPRMSPHKPAHSLSAENHRGAEGEASEGSSLPPISDASYSSRPQQEEVGLMRSTDANFHLLPCRICNRKFISGRLEKHVQICKKVNKSQRRVFNSYINRTKGSAIEDFWKTHSRSKSPEGRLPAAFPK